MNNFIDTFKKTMPNISIRIDKKQLIAELKACMDNIVNIDINTNNLNSIIIRTKDKTSIIRTKN